MVLRGEITKEKLINIYDTINRIIKNQNCYYQEREIDNLKQDKKNIFIREC